MTEVDPKGLRAKVMVDKRKNRIWSVAAILLAAFSVWMVMRQAKDYSFADFRGFFENANAVWIIMALLCTLAYILFEGVALICVLKAFGYRRGTVRGILYSAADIYFSAITPSASGGQPASAFFMVHDGIPTAVTAVALLLNLMMYTASTMTIGLIAVCIRPSLFINFTPFSMALIVIGYLILGILMLCIILLIRHSDWVYSVSMFLLRILKKLRLSGSVKRFEGKIDRLTAEYRECSRMVGGNRNMLLKCFLWNLLQRILQICVSAMLYIAGGGSPVKAADVWATHAFAVIGSSCIPVPGAMGVIDYLIVDGLKNLMPEEDAISLELLSRGISFYLCVLICGIIVSAGYFMLAKGNNSSKSEDVN